MNYLRKFAAVSVLIGAGFPLAAQTVPQEQTPDEEIVILSPFEVTGTKDTGYQATETLAGTRIRTNLKDVASAITVITEEFLKDVGATDSATLLQYTPNAEVAGTRGTFAGLGNAASVDESGNLINPAAAQRVRGLAAADNTRDFFGTDISWDSYIVDRIDINRGANSFLFGLGSPAGIVNASVRSAEFIDKGRVEAKFGSYGSGRFSLDLNEQLIDNTLAIRVAGLWDHEKFRQDPAFEDDERIFGAVRWDPQLFSDRTWRTSIRAKYEHGEINANRFRIIPPNDSITPWFRPDAATPAARDINSGMGKLTLQSGYYHNGAAVGTNYQTAINPWLGATVNQQQPMWFIDGETGDLLGTMSGYINNGGRNATGGFTGAANGITGRRYAEQLFRLRSLDQYATTVGLPGASLGQFRTQSLMDATVFDFYDNLIDGPNKNEWEDWDAYNIDVSQTMFDDRLAFNLVYDRQYYDRGGQQLLGGSPTLTIDILQNLADYYLTPSATETGTTNPNLGRPYTISSGGSGSSYYSDREHKRASLFAELRASDFLDKDSFLERLLGKHRFNGVYSTEDYGVKTRRWVMEANPQDWAAFWNASDGSGSSVSDRPPTGIFYLGPSIASRSSASGAFIPRIMTDVSLPNTAMRVMDSTWTAGNIYGDPWTPTGNLTPALYPLVAANGNPITYTQSQNPANYLGWTGHQIDLLRYNYGEDPRLLTGAAQSERKTKSFAGSWQGFLWNEAIVATLGWRYDEIQSKAVNFVGVGSNRNILNRNPDFFTNATPAIFKDHSTAGGVVVHLNKLLEKDPLPFNLSVSYNKSSNFQITDARRNIYGEVIPNPTGATKDYGVQISTKDGRYSLRAVKYETTLVGGSSGIGDPAGIGRVIAQGLRFRNVFLYDLGVYDWGSRNQPQGRNTWGGSTAQGDPVNGAVQTITAAEGRQLEDNAILVWNQIQADLTARGFFQAWGFTPQEVPLTLDRSTYEANPSAYVPANTGLVSSYGATAPPGFTVTADTVSKGYELELTANPTPNWRIAFNASRTEATRSNVGGPVLDEYIAYIDEKLATPIGTFTDQGTGQQRSFTVGDMPQFGNSSLSIYANVYGPWRSNYASMKLQEGSAAPEIRKWRFNFITNYSFTEGRLKGFGVGGSYRWLDDVIIGYPVVSGGGYDFSRPYRGPTEDAIDLWVSYEKKLTRNVDWRIQLNIRNAFADDELIPISVQPDGQTWASVRIAPTQEWFVTNTFSF